MAIAAIVLHVPGPELEGAIRSLQKMPELLEAAQGAPERVAATFETPASKLLECLQKCQKIPGVLGLELVYVNYEDDMDKDGFIDCGPLDELRRKLKNKS